MDIESFRAYCIRKPGVTESFPFDSKILVFKVMGKMFALADADEFVSINLKCDPELAVALREAYPAVLPGYHMNKAHWNTVLTDGSVGDRQLYEWIDNSYDLIVEHLSRKLREELRVLNEND